ncbi:MAG: DUF3306 domain-containing protein [Rhodocyclaceae bacterium]|nr:DUF3306 domain-containing protein [Rhodocyclaceae bacterium]
MSDGLFSRWAKRKQDVAAANEKVIAAAPDSVPTASVTTTNNVGKDAAAKPAMNGAADGEAQPLPSIESLTADSDFAPFMAKDVAPDMRNQAMKKLFTDPHYNVMDGLDIYIDDYGKPDPLPEGWLQLMNQSKTLHLFETAEEEAARLGKATVVERARVENAATAQSGNAAVIADVDAASSEQLAADGAFVAAREQLSHDIPVPSTIEPKLT